MPGGWDFLTFEVDRKWVFRFPAHQRPEEQIRREFGILPLLGRRLGVPIPEYRFRSEPTRSFPHRFGGYPRLPGIRVDRAHLTGPGLARVGEELGRAVARLHALPARAVTRAGIPFRSIDDCRLTFLRWGSRIRTRVGPLLDGTSRRRLDALLERLRRRELYSFRPVVTHNDLLPVHVLVDPKRAQITGLLDWGDVEFGDPAFDFGVMGWMSYLGPAMLRAYGGPPDPHFLERADAYRRLVASHTIVRARKFGDPELQRIGLRLLAGALATDPVPELAERP
ncbi:MAG: phosphotransferase [Thermoplasmata archaeon]